MRPTLSVIIPSLNVVSYIEQCMKSVVTQTKKDIEIICVDAGSIDGTLDVLFRYTELDSRIRLIHSPIKSYGYQVNLGIASAVGDYIAIVDSDDFVDSKMYELLYSIAIKDNSEIVMSDFFKYSSCDESNLLMNRFLGKYPGGRVFPSRIPELILLGQDIWANIYSKIFLLKNNVSFLETPGASFQDTAFAIKSLLCASNVSTTNDAFYHYRIDNQTSSIHSSDKVFCVCEELNAVDSFIEKRNLNNNEICKILLKKKFLVYCWNIKRLTKESALSFLLKIRAEFQLARDQMILSDEYFNDCIEDINLLIDNPKVFLLTRDFLNFEKISADEDILTLTQCKNYFLLNEINQLRNENKRLLSSYSYKLGSLFLFLPRKIILLFSGIKELLNYRTN